MAAEGFTHSETTPWAPAAWEQAWQRLRRFLQDRHYRVTRTRRIVCDRIFAHTDHFRADDIARELAAGPDRVSRATVYHTLALLVDAGMVEQVRDDDRHTHYEHVLGRQHHEHMVCEGCGRFIEFTAPALPAMIREACRKAGFTARRRRLVVFGLCADCADCAETSD